MKIKQALFSGSLGPTVVYAGLGFIAIAHIITPISFYVMQEIPPFEIVLPTEFWVAWGGLVTTWSVGRTFEKRGLLSE